MNKRIDRRGRILAALNDFRSAVAVAYGAAGHEQDRIAKAHAELMVELWLRGDRSWTTNADLARVVGDPAIEVPSWTGDPVLATQVASPNMADVVAKVRHDHGTHFTDWAGVPLELTTLVTRAAPGAAGEPWQTWLGTIGTEDGMGDLPDLWRIGMAVADEAPEQIEFPLAVPLLDNSHLHITTTSASRGTAEALVETLVLRVLSYLRPGLAHIHVWDTGQLTGSLPGLYPLTRSGLLTVHDSARPGELLDELSDHIRRVHTGVLAGGDTSLKSTSGRAGRRTEPWRIAVLFGNHHALQPDQQQQLHRVARNGLASGVQLIVVDVPMTVNSPMETIDFIDEHTARCSMTGPFATFTPDPPLPRADVPRACAAIADELEARRARLCTFDDLMPASYWTEHSGGGLRTPVGRLDGEPVDVLLGDSSPHALVGGPSGSGKTNFLYALLGGLTARYSPDELELYLLDFKEGVSFAQFTPGKRDPTSLPHARLVGVNVNADREFGVALLMFLADTMRSRADAAKDHEVTKLEELRMEDPDGRWPRIVAVIDEFQYLFAERDPVATKATQLLEDVARRGRSQGIHLVLASQDVSSIEAFWGKPAIFEQFILRIALPKARRVLAETNDAAVELPRWHAIVNHESGVRQGNVLARIPDSTSRGTFDELQQKLWQQRQDLPVPRLFDGSHVPPLTPTLDSLRPTDGPPSAVLGQIIDVAGSPATITLPGAPGRNLAVVGSSVSDAASILGAAALSIARQHAGHEVEFTLCQLTGDSAAPVERLLGLLELSGHSGRVVKREEFREFLSSTAEALASHHNDASNGKPHYVFCYGVDAAHALLETKDPGAITSGIDKLRAVLRHGPEHRTHVLGWWRGVGRLKQSLPIGQMDDIGPWIAFDVQGQELQTLAPGQVISWSPRARRGLFFDRFEHARPQVIIPFDWEVGG